MIRKCEYARTSCVQSIRLALRAAPSLRRHYTTRIFQECVLKTGFYERVFQIPPDLTL